ncbi:glutamate synthase small subunit [Sphingomonas changbaiensis NBRC 104936]|uniref:Glutamate synthase small subunit n=1 Tax=Sphingomonas changbaiensis NBRC 104936 TaxID=1219043 RepID=A0A0E9MSY3_9SPHN|nr:NAD(P)-dependent oxidoreductase [Sphingomonas changbaiensis]GAO40689.1 glutamate synthase small subunit [Sphingomonas changbaiensis NBRC 104936]
MAESPMLTFVGTAQAYPAKRPPELRAEDFHEIAGRYPPAEAEAQSARCSQCGVPYCSVHCPLHNHIPDWLRLTAEGRLQEAYELSNATSTMPEICGRICPQDRLCEGNCVIEFSGHGAVTIGSVEKFITDTAWEEGWVEPLRPGRPTGQSVGIVGAGPAGLTAAEYLRAAGHDVHVYDRHDRAGGLLTYGIPGFKLEKEVVMRRIARLEGGGIVFHLGSEVGGALPFADLRARHDALLIATGVYKPRGVKIPTVIALNPPLQGEVAREARRRGVSGGKLSPAWTPLHQPSAGPPPLSGEDLGGTPSGIVEALDYLIASNRKGFGDRVPAFDNGALNAAGKRVVVIGGGDTAMDCVRTAVRQGAASVKCLYRRDRANMPGSQREVAHAEEEGVEFLWLSAPEAFEAAANGWVSGVRATRMRLGAADASGRRMPEPDVAGGFRLDADLVIKALGFDPEELPAMFGTPELGVTRWGTLRIDHQSMMTSIDGVFAAGDIVRGASLVVWAIRDGRDVAEKMRAWLRGRTISSTRRERIAA